ncbi:MAG: hypothetical protein IKV93_00485 [Alphaproteobacteria bacterium]|nr:hypothetical protein [Alphaproteobacteria bacterium]
MTYRNITNYSPSGRCDGCDRLCYIGTQEIEATRLYRPVIAWNPILSYIPAGKTKPETLIYGAPYLARDKAIEITKNCIHYKTR